MKKIVFILFFISINIFAQNPFSTPTILPGANTDMSQAVIFGDYDNDGWTDLYVSKGSDLGNSFLNLLYKNTSGSLTKQTVSGITDILEVSGSASWGDYNNDGYLDLYVANALNKKNNLFFGNSNGGFVNKTNDNSLGPIVNSLEDSRHVGWGDYNNDGYIDVFVKRANGLGQDYSSFFENINGTSSVQKNEAQIGAIVTSSGDIYKSLGATFGWCDYNNDGYLDIYSAKGIYKDNTLWKTNNGSFSDVTPSALRPVQTSTQGFSWGDFDNDGDFDLFAGIKPEASVKHSFLFENSSTSSTTTFTDVTSSKGGPVFTNQYYVQGSSFIDIDNDGDLDLFTGTRESGTIISPPSILYQNSGATGSFIFSQLQQIDLDPGNGNSDSEARGVAFADLDNDGYLDMIVAREGEPLLYMNNKTGNNFSLIKLVGKGSTNSSAIGSRVKLVSNLPEQGGNTTQIREVSGQTGFGGQNDLRAHFGLGTATKIDEIKAQWLNSTGGSARQENIYTDIPTNKFIVFTQGNLNVGASVIKSQNFMYLFGNTGGSVEFTTADADGGTLTMQRTDSDPGGTFSSNTATNPGGGTITANAVYPDQFWTISQTDLTGFSSKVYFDGNGLTGSPDLDDVVLLQRANNSSDWVALNTNRIGNTLYSSGVTSFSEFAIGYEEAPQTVLLETKIFLEGAYDVGAIDPIMRSDITVPVTSPYIENVRTIDPIPADIVDWVLVELRSTDTGSAVVSKSALLHKDGRVVNDDASSGQVEIEAVPGSYYIVIKHRNHLAVMSADPVPLNENFTTLYNFTN